MVPNLKRIAPRWSLTHFVGVCALALMALGRFFRSIAKRRWLFGGATVLTVGVLVLVGCGHESKPLSASERSRAESVEVSQLPEGAEFYLSDVQESPLAVVDANGAVRSRAAYHAYGQVRRQVGASGEPFGYLRNEEDRGSGLSDFGARPYRPELGAFLAPDPVGLFEPEKVIGKPTVGQGYAYASGDPINTIDRDGRCGTPYAVPGMGCEKSYGPQLPEGAQRAVDEGAVHAPEHVLTFMAIVDGAGLVVGAARLLAGVVTRKLLGVALKEGAEAIAETAVSMAAKSGAEGAAKGALQFGADDLVYGPSARGALRQLQQSAGGRLLTDVGGPAAGQSWAQFSVQTMQRQLAAGGRIRFDLTHVKDVPGALQGTGEFGNTVTATELRFLKENWSEYKSATNFYRNGAEVATPW